MRIIAVLSSFMFLFLFSSDVLATNASSCVQCHTDEALMKSLHKPPVITAGEEGEG